MDGVTPRLTTSNDPLRVYAAPWFTEVPLFEAIGPAIVDYLNVWLPILLPPYVDPAAEAAVQAIALLRAGDTATGPIFTTQTLPQFDNEFATKLYVDTIAGTVAAGIYQGVWNPATNVPDLMNPPPLDQYQWICAPVPPGGVVITAVLPGLTGQRVNSGDHVIWINNVAQFGIVPAGDLSYDQALTLFLPLAGGTMTGALTLAAGQQTLPAHAATRGQALLLTGGTMAGSLTLAANAATAMQAVPLQQLNAEIGLYLPLAGGALTGPLQLQANAATALQAVPLQQLNAEIGLYLPLAGGALTGPLQLQANAATALQAVPLQQLDAEITTALNNIGRNLIHNGLFNIWQRGDGPFSAIGYTADRWLLFFVGGTAAARHDPALDVHRAQTGDEDFRNVFEANIAGGAAPGDFTIIEQRVEGVYRLAGRTVTLSFWAATSSVGARVAIELYQDFGTGGAPSPVVPDIGMQAITPSDTQFTRFSVMIAVPDTVGKTFGTNNDSFTGVRFWLSAAAGAAGIGVQTQFYSMWGVQLEVGSVATPLEKPDPQIELANCQRFFQLGAYHSIAYAEAAAFAGGVADFRVYMRAAPTIQILLLGTDTNVGTANPPDEITGVGFRFSFTSVAAGTVLGSREYHASADL